MVKILIALENISLGGMKRATTVVGNALSQHHEVTYYSFSDIPPFYTLTAPLLSAKNPVTLTNDAQPFEHFQTEINDFIAVIQQNQYDVVILSGGLLSSFAKVMKPRLPGVKLIGWMHNNMATYVSEYYRAMQDEFVGGLSVLDHIVALTDSDLAGFYQYNHQTVKIWNPLTIQPDGQANLQQKTIAFTARIAIQHKGIDFAVAFASKLPEGWCLAMAGSGTDSDMAEFQRLVVKYQAQDKIIYRGPLKDDELRQHYRQASMFLQTSRWEGLPLVLAEAMSFGLPIVAMANTGSKEVLDSGKYGVLTPQGDVDALVAAVEPLLARLELRQYYAQQSLTRVQAFASEPIIAQWEKLFK